MVGLSLLGAVLIVGALRLGASEENDVIGFTVHRDLYDLLPKFYAFDLSHRLQVVEGNVFGGARRFQYRLSTDERYHIMATDFVDSLDFDLVISVFDREMRESVEIENTFTEQFPMDVEATIAWAIDGRASYSLDGRYAVYEASPCCELHVMDMETLQVCRIPTADYARSDLDFQKWSPDNRFLMFFDKFTDDVSVNPLLYILDVNQCTLRHVLVNSNELNGSFGNWSPDGNYIAYFVDNTIYITTPQHPETSIELTTGLRPAWSPDGTQLLFTDNGDLYVINVDGTNRRNLTNFPSYYSYASQRVWTPDGSQIVFASNRDGNWNLYTMDADGSNLRRVTNVDGYVFSAEWQPLP